MNCSARSWRFPHRIDLARLILSALLAMSCGPESTAALVEPLDSSLGGDARDDDGEHESEIERSSETPAVRPTADAGLDAGSDADAGAEIEVETDASEDPILDSENHDDFDADATGDLAQDRNDGRPEAEASFDAIQERIVDAGLERENDGLDAINEREDELDGATEPFEDVTAEAAPFAAQRDVHGDDSPTDGESTEAQLPSPPSGWTIGSTTCISSGVATICSRTGGRFEVIADALCPLTGDSTATLDFPEAAALPNSDGGAYSIVSGSMTGPIPSGNVFLEIDRDPPLYTATDGSVVVTIVNGIVNIDFSSVMAVSQSNTTVLGGHIACASIVQ